MSFVRVFFGKRRRKWFAALGLSLSAAIIYWSGKDHEAPEYSIGDVTLVVKVNSMKCGENPDEGMALSVVRVMDDPDGLLKQKGRVVGPFPGKYVIIACSDGERDFVRRYGDDKFFERTYNVRLKSRSDSPVFNTVSVIGND